MEGCVKYKGNHLSDVNLEETCIRESVVRWREEIEGIK